MMNTTEELGKYFGYPTCCIKAYEEIQRNAGRKTPEQAYIAATDGGNFIPCPTHAKQITEGKIAIKSLIKNRICPTPYPNEPDIKELDEHLGIVA